MAQNPITQELIKVHSLPNTSDMNNIANPMQGNLIFVESTNFLYFFDGSTWVSTTSTGGTADGDAWGVNGEDINSEISRTGKVTIGTASNTNEMLDVRGSARILTLTPTSNLRPLVHNPNGQLRSDRYSFHYASFIDTSTWTNINFVKRGVTVSGYYRRNIANCSSTQGHFQFLYEANTNTFTEFYHNGNGITGPANFGTEWSITGNPANGTTCNSMEVRFRINNNQLQVRVPPTATEGYLLNLRIDAY